MLLGDFKGTGDMIQDCRNAGLPEPDFSLTDGFVTTEHRKPGRAFERANYLHPALSGKLIEYTIPDKPNSRLQKYRLTKKGAGYLKKQGKK